MPELPDVEVFKQYLDATSLHKKVKRVEVKDNSVLAVSAQTLRNSVESYAFKKNKRIGKHLFLSVGSVKWLMLHFGMTGNVQYSEDKSIIPDHTRILFHFKQDEQLAYICQRKLGSIDITESPDQFCKAHSLGEDALEINLEKFRQILGDKRGMIKTTLMDQSTIAGLGNVYSDEILYQSNIHPKTKTAELSDEQLKNLHQNMLRILKTAIDNHASPDKMPDHYLISHREEGADCPDCSGTINRIKVSGRSSYICADCQKKS